MEVDSQFLESRADASRFLHPPDTLFDDGSLSVGRLVEFDSPVMVRRFVALVRNDRLDPSGSKPIANAPYAVPFVGGQSLRACSRAPQTLRDGNAVHHRLDLRRFMDLPGGDLHGQGSSLAVSNQVELRSKPASAAAQSVVAGSSGCWTRLFSQRRQRLARHGRSHRRCTKDPSQSGRDRPA